MLNAFMACIYKVLKVVIGRAGAKSASLKEDIFLPSRVVDKFLFAEDSELVADLVKKKLNKTKRSSLGRFSRKDN